MLNAHHGDITSLIFVCGRSGRIDDGGRLYAVAATRLSPGGEQDDVSFLIPYPHLCERDRRLSGVTRDQLTHAPTRRETERALTDFCAESDFIITLDTSDITGEICRLCGTDRVLDLGFAVEYFFPAVDAANPKGLWEFLRKRERGRISFSATETVALAVDCLRAIAGIVLNDGETGWAPTLRYYLAKSGTLFGAVLCHVAYHYRDYFGELFTPVSQPDTGNWRRFCPVVAPPSPRRLAADMVIRPVDGESLEQYYSALVASEKTHVFRPVQVAYARHVANILNDGGILALEAGTGTGKTQGYLIPAMEFLRRNPASAMVISTYTKSLQDQIMMREIPRTQHLSPLYAEIPVTFLKGKSSYICVERLDAVTDDAVTGEEIIAWLYFVHLALSFRTADLDSVGLQVRRYLGGRFFFRRLLSEISSRMGCTTRHRRCPAQVVAADAARARLVVTNHHKLALFHVDPVLKERFTRCIIDEATHFDQAVRNASALSVSSRDIADGLRYLRTVFKRRRGAGDLAGLLSTLNEAIDQVEEQCNALTAYRRSADSEGGQDVLVVDEDMGAGVLDRIVACLTTLRDRQRGLVSLLTRILEGDCRDMLTFRPRTAARLRAVLTEHQEYLHIFETALQAVSDVNLVVSCRFLTKHWMLTIHRVDLAPVIRDGIIADMDAVVATSATLSSNQQFDCFLSLWGLDGREDLHVRTVEIPSPDTVSRLSIIVPEESTSGGYTNKTLWFETVTRILPRLIDENGGRTLVLFASYGDLTAVADAVGPTVIAAGYPLLVQQNGMPTGSLCTEFRDVKESVLFGVDSFWYGVDFKGDTLTQVIITRLPYPNTHDPVQKARRRILPPQDYWRRYHYETEMKLKQGMGRLIRSEGDRGRVVILDNRFRMSE